ncbi:MAG: alpha amylase C-terminal domain-containing protein [Prevotellaceae bacterium]|jgi:1,4-alpha-glucan branching enzyme|nr:alpha amylase C-terminal domain-containing protein [Prevotellaceae bacterium]
MTPRPSPLALIANDSGLAPYEHAIRLRMERRRQLEKTLCAGKASLAEVANNHLYYGLHRSAQGWTLREWAPAAQYVYLIGSFNGWKPDSRWGLRSVGAGNWEISLPPDALRHADFYKLLVVWDGGSGERIPSYCRRVVQDDATNIFAAQVWDVAPYEWKNNLPLPALDTPLVYEAHIGMATESYRVGTYDEFRRNVLPRIAQLGYNVVQLMAIQEHPYYGSFGYQVSSFFAPSSRFGTPDELKALVDDAHGLGLAVIMDLVQSHAVKNANEGLSLFDGTDYLYFHAGERGRHPVWDSRCFNYGKHEVITFLLSSCKYWMDEFHFDGFRFDGVTSMMYTHHGLGIDFVSYDMYFDGTQDEDAIAYLALANRLVHLLNPRAICVAEDVSGMPGLAAPLAAGGLGFDFRMSMGVADFWVKTLKAKRDEDWHVGDMFHHLTDKRTDERTISYAECHDQALVGDKTIAFWLLDREMYSGMSSLQPASPVVDRGVALHKLIRLATLSAAGNGYLTFMGNEFGHPEWIDFPREGNSWSYHYARRQWHLADDPTLRYRYLLAWDEAMIQLARSENFFAHQPFALAQHTVDQMLIFKRGDLVFAFNFNPAQSFVGYGFAIDAGEYRCLLCSDSLAFGGFARVDEAAPHFTVDVNGTSMLKLYLPSRTAMVLKKI